MALHVIRDDRADWLAWRRQGIGASDASAICGFNSYTTPLMVYLTKLGLIAESELGEAAEWGLRLEGPIAAKFEEATGFRVVRRQECVEHPERPWQRATLDGLVVADDEIVGVYEGKTVGHRRAEDWLDDEGEFQVPIYYRIQVQHALAVTGLPVAHVAVLIGGQHFERFEVERDEKAIEHITAIEEEFWQGVLSQNPPPPDGSDETTAAVREAFAEIDDDNAVELSAEALETIRERQAAAAAEKIARERLKRAQNVLALTLRGATVGTFDGEPVLRWTKVASSEFDLERFRADHPRLAAQYTNPTSYRRFSFPKRKEG